jgi:hypothetical protein
MKKIIFKIIIIFILYVDISVASERNDNEKAVQMLMAAADELAGEVAKINKRHSREYFKKRIGQIFIHCSKSRELDIMLCIKPRVESLTKE